MFCHNCGTKGIETAAFCGKCGTKFRKVKDDVVKPDIQNIPPKPDRLRIDDTRSERIKELDRKKRPPKPDKIRTDDIRSGFWKDRHKKKTKQNDYDKIRREQDKHFEQSHNKTWKKKKPFSKPNDNNRSSKPSNRNTKSKPFPIASLIILGILLLGGVYLYPVIPEIVDEIVDAVNSIGLSNEEILEMEDEIERLINIEREKHGLQPLAENALLRKVAYSHSLDMAENNYFQHNSLDGKDASQRGFKSGYSCEREIGGWIYYGLGENLAIEPSSGLFGYFGKNSIPSGVVRGWMESPGHKRNILDPTYIYGEIAIALSSEGTFPASTFVGAVGDDGRALQSPALVITHNFAVCKP